MDYCCFRKKPSPEKPGSESLLSRKKVNPNRCWLIGQSSSAPEKKPTDFSEPKDETGTSHRKTPEHDIPQWRIELKDISLPDQTQEVKELVSKINNKLEKFQETLKTSDFSPNTMKFVIDEFNSDIEFMKINGNKNLQNKLLAIQDKIKMISNITEELKIIQKLLEPEKNSMLRISFNEFVDSSIQIPYENSRKAKNAIQNKWELLSRYIEQIKRSLNTLNERNALPHHQA
jgi:hypothetical protein